eukprot:13646071-Alexandrium_andersonii.AAC.1
MGDPRLLRAEDIGRDAQPFGPQSVHVHIAGHIHGGLLRQGSALPQPEAELYEEETPRVGLQLELVAQRLLGATPEQMVDRGAL